MYKAILAVVLSTVVFFAAAGSVSAESNQYKSQTATQQSVQAQSMYQPKYAGTAESPVKSAYQTSLQLMLKNAAQTMNKMGGGSQL